jgi:hypothetical protein
LGGVEVLGVGVGEVEDGTFAVEDMRKEFASLTKLEEAEIRKF